MKKQVTFVADDGRSFPSEQACREYEAALSGFTFECPACQTWGTENGEPIYGRVYDEEATAQGGQFASKVYKKMVVGHEQVPCSTCNGIGWTEREKQPIRDQSIIGWEDVSEETAA